MVVRFVCVIRVPVCARVPRVFPRVFPGCVSPARVIKPAAPRARGAAPNTIIRLVRCYRITIERTRSDSRSKTARRARRLDPINVQIAVTERESRDEPTELYESRGVQYTSGHLSYDEAVGHERAPTDLAPVLHAIAEREGNGKRVRGRGGREEAFVEYWRQGLCAPARDGATTLMARRYRCWRESSLV